MIARPLTIAAAFLALSACGKAPEPKQPVAANKPTIRMTLIAQDAVTPGKPVHMLAKLNNIEQRRVVTEDQLAVMHTEKFHLLLVDPTLTDYQHIHPKATATRGIYSFSFTPAFPGGYRAWADLTPAASGTREYDMADIGQVRGGAIDKNEKHEALVNGYRFILSFDKPLVVGDESMATMTVAAPDGHPVKTLEPVMGAYAHMVGFYDDLRTVVHTHPMGEEPKNASDRGGPELMFHIEPVKAGFIKLFAQLRINGKEWYVPFGVIVAAKK